MYKQTFALLESVLEFSSSSTQPAKNVLKNSLNLIHIAFLGAISYLFFLALMFCTSRAKITI